MNNLKVGDVLHKTPELVKYVNRYIESRGNLPKFEQTNEFTVYQVAEFGVWITGENYGTIYIPRDIAEGMKP